MSSAFEFDDKGKVKRKTGEEARQEADAGQKTDTPLTRDQMKGDLDAARLTRMQQTLGNDAVQRYLAQRHEQDTSYEDGTSHADGTSAIDEETEASIHDKRGRGHRLNEDVAGEAGETMDRDFSDVTIHTDGEADNLSRRLGARAFTIGNDIFFREGAYEPGSRDGRKLIAHELTHVAQQGGEPANTVQGELRLNDPQDEYETQADDVADAVVNRRPTAQVQRQAQEEEEELLQAQEEEEEEMVQMQEMEEEEELQA